MAGKMSHGERVLLGQIGAYTALSRHSAYEMTEPARRAFASKFERDVDPEGVLRGSVGPHHDGVIVCLSEDRQRRLDRAEQASRKVFFQPLTSPRGPSRAGS